MLPSPACGRGAGGEGGRRHTDGVNFVDAPALTPTPLPRAGEGSVHRGRLRCHASR
ncbi:hypothetical protein CBM2589_B240075 [Cupriavidus taiwanensis]|uniref:Uncharacterized protein n=1 Tax=Cupriavidus taiwanensis TaxID=164546 RepID=A0A975X1G2_9BURK|nr:hypothetical protein CBM2589_B240075 [Cupriavidus taiwanensis]